MQRHKVTGILSWHIVFHFFLNIHAKTQGNRYLCTQNPHLIIFQVLKQGVELSVRTMVPVLHSYAVSSTGYVRQILHAHQ